MWRSYSLESLYLLYGLGRLSLLVSVGFFIYFCSEISFPCKVIYVFILILLSFDCHKIHLCLVLPIPFNDI